MPPGGARELPQQQKVRVFAALERLEDKATQHAAFGELARLLKELDTSNLSTLLHACGTTNAKTTTFARVHCMRLAAMCTQPEHCLQWRSMLASPLLPKLVTLLGRALHDPDSAVRAAAAEGFGVVAAQLAAACPAGCELTASSDANPLLSTILDALGEPGGGVQAAAAAALAAAADHLHPGLDPALLRQLLRALSNPLFLGRAELCGALARLEGGAVRGLVASSCPQLLAVMSELLGTPPGTGGGGSGLLGALAGKGKDFALRAAAAHTLKALAVGLGPLWRLGGSAGPEGQPVGWDAAAAALKAAKTDVSKPVRDAAAAALPVVQGLLAFLASGATAAAWPEVAGGLLASDGRTKRSSVVKLAAAGTPGGAEELGSGQQIAAVYPGVAAAPPAAAALLPSAACVPAAAALAAAPPHNAIQQLEAQLAAVQEQQAGFAAGLTSFTAFASSTLHGIERHLAEVSARLAALSASRPASPGGTPGLWDQLAPLQQHAAAACAAAGALRAGLDGQQQARPGAGLWEQAPQQAQPGAGLWEQKEAMHTSPQPVAQTTTAQAPPATQPAAPQRALPAAPTPQAAPLQQAQRPAPAAATPQHVQHAPAPAAPVQHLHPKRLSSLHRSYDALEHRWHQPIDAASPASAPSSPDGAGAVGPTPPPSLDTAYAQLLAGERLAADQSAQLRLLRALAKSGPAWEQLSAATGQRLMAALAQLLRAGAPLSRLLPWLWPLADTATAAGAAAARYPTELRRHLLDALAACPPPACPPSARGDGAQQGGAPSDGTGSGLSEKHAQLVSALRAAWLEDA